ncbi:hypothetical protein FRC12_003009 [Ceratobasidium sp. 428]|nr:hypothetical protein FRC12_003009 [Ceratobasidium sp. 428]
MHYSIIGVLSAVALFASSSAEAILNTTITLHNNCSRAVALQLSSRSGTPYKGPAIGSISAKGTKAVTVPDDWSGSICESVGGCANNCVGKCSMTEFEMNTGSLPGIRWNRYDISNVQGFTIAQRISIVCGNVTCTSANCPCDQAYRPGDVSGTCGGGRADQARYACGFAGAAMSVIYCP